MGENYFNSLPLRRQLAELSQCRFMDSSEFSGVEALKGKKIVIVGCGAQGLHQPIGYQYFIIVAAEGIGLFRIQFFRGQVFVLPALQGADHPFLYMIFDDPGHGG